MTHLSQRPVRLLTLLQALTVLVMIGGTAFACMLGYIGVAMLTFVWGEGFGIVTFVGGALLAVIAVSVCCYITLVSFIRVLERMKKGTAFTEQNCKGLGTMAASCGIAAAALFLIMVYWALALAGPTFINEGFVLSQLVSLGSFTAIVMIWPFGFGVVALLIQGVRLLMIRAMKLEREQAFVV